MGKTPIIYNNVSYGQSFFLINLWPNATQGHKLKGKTEHLQLTVQTKKTRLVRYIIYLCCVSDRFENDFYSCRTASNF